MEHFCRERVFESRSTQSLMQGGAAGRDPRRGHTALHKTIRRSGSVLMLLVLLGGSSLGEGWTRFRGPNGSGVVETTGLPTRFGPDEKLIWRTPFPAGHSSPVLTRDRIFLTAYEGEGLFTLAVERSTGTIRWRRPTPRPRKEPFQATHGPASPTPVTDGENVYVFFGDFGLVSYDSEGQERWRTPMGPFTLPNGHGSSPILVEDMVVQLVDHDQGSALFAFDREDGRLRWKQDRPEATHGYATPCLFPPGQPSQLIVPGSYQLSAYSFKGEKIWQARGLTWQVKPSAVVSPDRVFVTGWAPGADAGEGQVLPPFDQAIASGDKDKDGHISEPEAVEGGWRHGGGWGLVDLDNDGLLNRVDWEFFRARRSSRNATMSIRPGDTQGQLAQAEVLWRYQKAVPVVSSPLLFEGILYTVKDGGILTALDSRTGEVLKQGRIKGALDKYYASPVAADGKIYLASEDGRISTIAPGKDWRVLAVNDFNEAIYSTPAISQGVLYIRTMEALYAIGGPLTVDGF